MVDNVNILIVDDNTSLYRTMSLILRHKGYTVATAGDGLEAIERVKETPFDIIFMDIKMVPMDGVETYRRIKEVWPDTVVVMMTAYAVEDLVAEVMEEGAYGVVYKPVDPRKVVALVEEVGNARKGRRILVVDDDPELCRVIEDLLMEHNYEVALALTGEEAVALSRERVYDVLLIDMKLPTIDGLETYLAIKENTPEARAIMITGYPREMGDLVEEALSNRAHACLYKPFDMEEMLRVVAEIQERK